MTRRISMPRILARLVAAATLAVPLAAGAQWKPQRNVELIVPAEAGGSLDTTGRVVQRLWEQAKLVPTTSTVVNRSGGGHAVAYAFLAQRSGDPHFLSVTSSTLLTNHINGRLPYTYTDFSMLGVLLVEPIVFAVRSESPVKTGRDFVETLRANPQALSVAVASALGGTHHISTIMPLRSGGVETGKVKFVAFNSSTSATTALLGGHVDVVAGSAINILPHAKDGRLRMIAVSMPRRMTGDMASVPTWPEQGLKGVWENWRGIMGSPKMTPEQVGYWENVLRRVTQMPDFQEYAEKNQWSVSFSGAEDTRRLLQSQYADLKEIMAGLGLAK